MTEIGDSHEKKNDGNALVTVTFDTVFGISFSLCDRNISFHVYPASMLRAVSHCADRFSEMLHFRKHFVIKVKFYFSYKV